MKIRGWEAKQHEKDFALSAKKHELERKKRGRRGRNKMRVIPLLGKLGKIKSKNEELRMETTGLTTTRHAAQMLIFVISKINRTFQRLPFLHHTCDILFSLHLFCICR